MLKHLLLFEQKYQFRQYTFIGSAILFLIIGFILPRGSYGGSDVYKNAPYVISVGISLLSMSSLLVTTLFTANIVLRDSEYKMEELIFSTGLNKFGYVASRFLGLFISVLVVLLMSVAGMMLATLQMSSEQLGPFNIVNYLWPFLVFAIPNVLLCSTLLYATAVTTRSAMATYIAGVLIYILYLVGSILGNSPLMASSDFSGPAPDLLPVLSDPFGLASFFGETKYWSVNDRNTLLIPLKGSFLLNRLLWISLSTIILAIVYWWFSARLITKKAGKNDKEVKDFTSWSFKAVATDPNTVVSKWQIVRSVIFLEVKSILKSPSFYILLLLWIFLLGTELTETLFHQLFGISLYPVTGYITELVRNNSLIVIIIIFFCAEIIWRERSVKIYELTDSTPVANAVLFMGKGLSVLILIAIFISTLILTGIIVQLSHGYAKIELGIYLSLFYYAGLPLLLIGCLSLFIQTISPHKYLGILINCIIFGLILFSSRIGIEHYLLRYAVTPDLEYSELNGFAYFSSAFNWYMLYWSALAGIMVVLSFRLWKRGLQNKRWKNLAFNKKQSSVIIAGICLAVFIVSGGFIFYHTNLNHSYRSSSATKVYRAEYEKKYKRYETLSLPTITAVKTIVDLYPAERYYKIKGWYQLVNKNHAVIEKILVHINEEVSVEDIKIDKLKPIETDEKFGHYWFKLDKPLQAGEQLNVEFSFKVDKQGFEKFNKENYIVKGGSYIELEKYLPAFGYVPGIELDNPDDRAKNGLKAQVKLIPPKKQFYEWVQYESTISTAADEKVISIGDLQQEWTEKGRNYFSYKSLQPVPFMFAIASANYKVINYKHKNVSVSLFCKDRQNPNIAEMLKAVNNSLDYYTASYGPYQYKHLRIVEIPHYKGSATAYPGVLFCAERYNFLSNYSDTSKINYAYSTLAHEIAHEWWAGQLEPADAPGRKLLTETLAKHAETRMLEKKYGKTGLNKYLLSELNFYLGLKGYSGEKEQALALVENQNYVAYQKGGMIMNAINELIGEEKVNQALQSLLRKYAWPHKKASVTDLISELQLVTPVKYHELIDQWFNKVVMYDLKIRNADFRKTADGRYEITAAIYLAKKMEDADGNFVQLNFHEPLKIAVTTADNKLICETRTFTQTNTKVKFIIDQKPHKITIDPYLTRIEEDRTDNDRLIK